MTVPVYVLCCVLVALALSLTYAIGEHGAFVVRRVARGLHPTWDAILRLIAVAHGLALVWVGTVAMIRALLGALR